MAPHSKQSRYDFMGIRYYSLRFVSEELGIGNQTIHGLVKKGRLYYVLINNRPFIPDWSFYCEKVQAKDVVEIIQVESKALGYRSTKTVYNDEELLQWLKVVEYSATVKKIRIPYREFIGQSLEFEPITFFKMPSNDVPDFLIRPPEFVIAKLHCSGTSDESKTIQYGEEIPEIKGDCNFRLVIYRNLEKHNDSATVMTKKDWEAYKSNFLG
jgi:hypothetical protein